MALADLYVDGVLRLGPLLYEIDERRVHDAHRTTLDDVIGTLAGDDQRRRLCSELRGLWTWLEEGLAGTRWRVWLRGDFASTLRPDPKRLDLVVLTTDVRHNGFAWSLRTLSCRPFEIDEAYALEIKLLPGADLSTPSHDDERRACMHRCRDSQGEYLVTGWLELLGGGDA